MKRRIENWPVAKLYKERTRMTFPEYQREKQLWREEKKSLLIDSILRDIDIPKLYFNLLKNGTIEVIDGQQRLWSIWDFLDGEFRYSSDGKKAQRFSELLRSQKDTIEDYTFQVTVFDNAEEDYLRELFVRLQMGLLLNTGEKLHAARGKMKQLVFDKLAKHQFIQHLGIPKRRYALETLCAQICINSFTRKKLSSFARTRYDDLLHFFSEYESPRAKDLDLFEQQSTQIQNVLGQLWKCFGVGAKELRNRSYVLSIYLYVEGLMAGAAKLAPDDQKAIPLFSSKLWKSLKDEMKLGMNRKNEEIYVFQTLLSSAPGEEYQIRRRDEKIDEFYRHFMKTGKIKGD